MRLDGGSLEWKYKLMNLPCLKQKRETGTNAFFLLSDAKCLVNFLGCFVCVAPENHSFQFQVTWAPITVHCQIDQQELFYWLCIVFCLLAWASSHLPHSCTKMIEWGARSSHTSCSTICWQHFQVRKHGYGTVCKCHQTAQNGFLSSFLVLTR